MARGKGHLTDLPLRHRIKAGQPLAKADGEGLTSRSRPPAWPAGSCATGTAAGAAAGRTIDWGRHPDIDLAEVRGIANLKAAEVLAASDEWEGRRFGQQ